MSKQVLKYIIFYFLYLLHFNFTSTYGQSSRVAIQIDSPINGKSVSFTELLDALEAGNKLVPDDGKNYEYVIKDIKVRFVQELDKPGMDKRYFNGGKTIYIRPNIRMSDIDFDPEFWFVPRNIVFEGHFWITNTERLKAIFTECTFEKSLLFFSNDTDFIDFEKCKFQTGFGFTRGILVDHLKFNECLFDIDKELKDDAMSSNLGLEANVFYIDNKIENLDLLIQNTKFLVNPKLALKKAFFINLESSVFSNIKLINNTFNTSLNLQNASITNNFQLTNTKIRDYIFLYGLNANSLGTRIDWEEVTQKIAIHNPEDKKKFSYKDLKVMPIEAFTELFSAYSILYNAFKAQGDRYSTNRCYVEWKNVETAYLHKLSKSEKGDTVVYFTYVMNVFLSFFCDYGTNPLKSIYISIYVLFIFAIIYFFLPHNFGFQNNQFYKRLDFYASHLREPASLLNSLKQKQQEKKKSENTPFSDYLRTIQAKKTPFYFHIIAIPDYVLLKSGKFFMSLTYNLVKSANYLHGSKFWIKRAFSNLILMGIIFFIVLENLILRGLDCVALSINIFTTLGFGNTELKGIPMYLAVIEGFVGWFLLTFFSLSLISQLIN